MRLPTRGRATRPGGPMARCDGDHPRRDGPVSGHETQGRVAPDRHGIAPAAGSDRHGLVGVDRKRFVQGHQHLMLPGADEKTQEPAVADDER